MDKICPNANSISNWKLLIWIGQNGWGWLPIHQCPVANSTLLNNELAAIRWIGQNLSKCQFNIELEAAFLNRTKWVKLASNSPVSSCQFKTIEYWIGSYKMNWTKYVQMPIQYRIGSCLFELDKMGEVGFQFTSVQLPIGTYLSTYMHQIQSESDKIGEVGFQFESVQLPIHYWVFIYHNDTYLSTYLNWTQFELDKICPVANSIFVDDLAFVGDLTFQFLNWQLDNRQLEANFTDMYLRLYWCH